jgi:hypothetical protein
MERRACVVGACIVAFAGVASGGCARSDLSVQPGLANVSTQPGLAGAPATPPDDGTIQSSPPIRDVIANGNDSCPRARVASGDPLRYRFPTCPGFGEAHPTAPNLLGFTPPPSLPEPAALWNVHLHGLPPCSGTDERSKELAMMVCASEGVY